MGLYRRENGVFHLTITYKNRRIQRSTGTTNKRKAERIYAQVLADVHEGQWFKVESKHRTFEELRERYMTDYAIPNKAPRTVMKDTDTFNQLAKYFAGHVLSEITPQAIAGYKKYRREMGIKVSTLAKELELLRATLNVAVREWEWMDVNPFTKVRIEQPRDNNYRWLTIDEEDALVSKCADRIKGIVIFALNTGMRQDEILSLKWQDVDMVRKTLIVVKSKNGEQRTLPLNKAAMNILLSKGKIRHISGMVFPSQAGTKINPGNLRRAFNSARDKSGIDHVRFHDLRHTFATRLVQAGVDLYAVKELLGHKSIKMTMRYAHHYPESLRYGVDILDKIKAGDASVCFKSASGQKKGATGTP